MSIVEELVYEYWDCKYCKQLAVRGDLQRCPGCGHDRDSDVAFYRKDDTEEAVTDQAQAACFQAGPDWVCGFCQVLSSATAATCRACGAPRGDARGDYFDAQHEKAARAPQAAADLAGADLRGGRSSGLGIRLIAAAVLLGLGAWYWSTRSHDVEYETSAVHWERTIQVERYGLGEDSDWEDEITGDEVKRLSSSREVRRVDHREVGSKTESYEETEQYKSGTQEKCSTSYASTGSGAARKTTSCEEEPVYSTRTVRKERTVPVYEDVPIYDNKVRYRSRRYRTLRADHAEGRDSAPRWPEALLGTGEDGKPDREAKRSESYDVHLRKLKPRDNGPADLHIQTTEAGFTTRYKLGARVLVKIDNLGFTTLPEEDLRLDGL